jgi:hypothetical protein
MTAHTLTWSPWGSIQTLDPVGEDGIVHVRTAAHSGYFVPAELNGQIHEAWRIRTGWYGQGARDNQWAIVVITFPALFTRQVLAHAHAVQRNASADSYAQATSVQAAAPQPAPEPEPDAPPLKAAPRRRHPQFHPQGPVATSVWADWHDSVPEGFVGVCAAPDNEPSAQAWFLVPAPEYNGRTGFRFVVDPERHPVWTDHPGQ